uniref:NFX1-type zinc finger-containing protein 1-like n=1 Tax=Scleropages formosus TaxID=113540 RepID=A0A8C9VAK4_SCLFO
RFHRGRGPGRHDHPQGHQNIQAQMWPSVRTCSQPNLSYTHSHSKDSENRVRNISRKKQLDITALENILKKEASEIVMILAAPNSGLKELLNKEDHTNALTVITLEVLNKACGTQTCKENLRHLLTTVKDSSFLKRSLPELIMTVDAEYDQGNVEQKCSKLDKIMVFDLNLLRVFPCSTFTDVSLTVVLLENEYENCQSAGRKIPEESRNWLKTLQTTLTQLQKKKLEGILMSDQDSFTKSDHTEDQNFRSLSVYPTHQDVCSDEWVYMETSNTSGKFKDSSSYLDTYFHLLRKGFMKPLRDRITHLLKADENVACEGRVETSLHSHVYFNTSIILPVCTRRGMLYRVRFDTTKLRTVNWESSKNLLSGTLVCLSKDRFETMIWATVAKRDVRELVQGITHLSFTEESRLKLANISPSDTFTMVDSAVDSENYWSILEGLQEMATENLPMQKYIISCEADILTAKYLENNENLYSLKGLMDCHALSRGISGPEQGSIQKMGQETHKGSVSSWHLKNILNLNEWPTKEELSLDYSQLKALQDALTKELAVIQGQPGAGKTYVGLRIIQALVDNAHIWGAGAASPILVVCPNNHVLDALLEGITNCPKCCILPDASWLVRVGGQSSSNFLNDLSLDNLKKMPHIRQSLPQHLRSMHWQVHCRSASFISEAAFINIFICARSLATGLVEMKRSLEAVVKQELHKVDHMPEVDARQITDLWALPLKERWHLYRLWLSIYQKDVKAAIMDLEIQYEAIAKRIEEVRLMEDERILKQAKVIGMTTAGVARYRKLLQEIRPGVILVEEAQEVPEAHVVTTLTSACQHLILIGDRQQFCPCPPGYEQDKTLLLERSLFERLIQEGFPSVRLENQHRMHPDIAQILTPHIYNKLNNQNSVEEKIKGVTTNIFFLDHKHHEEIMHRGQGHQNLHEVSFMKSLCQYLIYQGYRASQITVLTPCEGQIVCLRKCMPKSTFLGVKVCLVDEFQGRENDIIILSLVRSDMEGQADLWKNSKYIGIALSRAKKAFYCVGNMTAHSALPMWSKILSAASSCRQVGEALILHCENHPAIITAVSKEDDFLKVPLGGCLQPCSSSLSCGHTCSRPCHPNWDHKCGYSCNAEDDTWLTNPPMSHEQDAPYHDLTRPCGKPLPCEHTCAYDRGHSNACCCSQKVIVELQCGHQQSVLCHVWQKREQQPIKCMSRCEARLICSHQCRGKCGAPCVPCTKPCRTKCYHQRCQRSCLVACQPCSRKCGWLCSHYHCTKLCLEPCDRPPCSMPCRKLLRCQHPCIGMCGEPCPGKCRVCDADEVRELFFGSEADPGARFVQLADCRHIFEVRGFDSWIAAPEESGLVGMKACPKCDVPIRQNLRCNRVIKGKLHELEVLKQKATVVLSAQTQDMVKEMESKGIMSSFVPPLLSTLNELDVDIPRGVHINKQITLLLQLSEIRNKIQMTMPGFLPIINYQLDVLTKEIIQANGDRVLEYECQVRRITLLAEAQKLSGKYMYPQCSPAISAATAWEHEKLDAIITDLSVMPLLEKDVKKLETSLNDIARNMKVPLSMKFLEETSKVAMNFSFLKLNHWSKCSNNHIYYNRGADGVTKSEVILFTVVRQGTLMNIRAVHSVLFRMCCIWTKFTILPHFSSCSTLEQGTFLK